MKSKSGPSGPSGPAGPPRGISLEKRSPGAGMRWTSRTMVLPDGQGKAVAKLATFAPTDSPRSTLTVGVGPNRRLTDTVSVKRTDERGRTFAVVRTCHGHELRTVGGDGLRLKLLGALNVVRNIATGDQIDAVLRVAQANGTCRVRLEDTKTRARWCVQEIPWGSDAEHHPKGVTKSSGVVKDWRRHMRQVRDDHERGAVYSLA